MDVQAVLNQYDRAVVIVHYRREADYNGGQAPQNPACLLQVTLLKSKLSPSQKLIRLGETKGDEIMGWTKLESLEVVERLGVLGVDSSTVTPQWPPPWSLEAKPQETA